MEGNLGLGGVSSTHVGIFDLEHVKVIWGHSVHFSKNWPVNRKWLIIVRNGRNLGLDGVCSMHVGIFDFEHVKLIFGHSVHFYEKAV